MAAVRTASLLLVLLAACSEGPRRGRCNVELLEVTWPATIERGDVATREQLSAAVTLTTLSPEVFDSLRQTLVRGRPRAPAVLWSVPAFNTSPGGISVVHAGALKRGALLRVAGVQDGGGWAVMPRVSPDSALVGVEAGEFAATTASGTIAVLETEPLALRLDVTARDSAGSAVRVRGDVQFSFRRERRPCVKRSRE
jgi:hypothetical protein